MYVHLYDVSNVSFGGLCVQVYHVCAYTCFIRIPPPLSLSVCVYTSHMRHISCGVCARVCVCAGSRNSHGGVSLQHSHAHRLFRQNCTQAVRVGACFKVRGKQNTPATAGLLRRPPVLAAPRAATPGDCLRQRAARAAEAGREVRGTDARGFAGRDLARTSECMQP